MALPLARSVPCRMTPRLGRRSRFREIVLVIGRRTAGAAVVAMLCGLVIGPRSMRNCSGSKTDRAMLETKQLADEVLPEWRLTHAGCPTALELVPYLRDGRRLDLDPWGVPYDVRCPEGGIVVHSRGEDRVPNTDDDVWSDR